MQRNIYSACHKVVKVQTIFKQPGRLETPASSMPFTMFLALSRTTTWTELLGIAQVASISSNTLAIARPECKPRNCFAWSMICCRVKSPSIHCAVKLMRDNGFTLQLQMSVVKLIAFISCNMHTTCFFTASCICGKTISVTWRRLGISYFGSKTLTKRRNPTLSTDWKRLIVKNNELGKHLCYLFGSRVISCHFLSSCKGLLQGWLLSGNVTASGKFSVLTFVFQFQMFYHITSIISTAFCTSSWYFCGAKFAVCHAWVVIINVEIFPHCWAWHSVAAAGDSVHWKFCRWRHGVSVFGIGVLLRVRVHELSLGPDTHPYWWVLFDPFTH